MSEIKRFRYAGTQDSLERTVEGHEFENNFTRLFYGRKDRDIEYNINKIPVGWNHQGELITINFNHPRRIIFCAPSGAGKTYLLRSLMGRLHAAGSMVTCLNDTKPEYGTSINPIQPQFKKDLLKGELPKGLPIKNYFPYFLYKNSDRRFQNTETFQLRLQDLDLSDLDDILNLSDPSGTRSILIRSAFDKIISREVKTVKELADQFPNSVIKRVVESIDSAGIIGEEKQGMPFTEALNKGYLPVLNMYGGERYSSGVDYSLIYLAIILRRLYNDKRSGKLPQKRPMTIIIDEMSRVCSIQGMSPSKKAIEFILSQGRIFKVSVLMAAQVPEQIPDIIFKQSNMIFIPEGVDVKDAVSYVSRFAPGDSDWSTILTRNMQDLLGSMSRFEWLMINREKERGNDQIEIIRSVAPFSCHLT